MSRPADALRVSSGVLGPVRLMPRRAGGCCLDVRGHATRTRHVGGRPEMTQRTGLLLVLVVALISASVRAPDPVFATSFVVNSTADEPDAVVGDGSCSSAPSGACTLRAAVMEAQTQM